MPVQKTTSSLLVKYGSRLTQAAEKFKESEPEIVGGDLPAGINGIAQLKECRFAVVKEGKKSAGEVYFYAMGVVQKPDVHDGIPVKGQQTRIMEMICDTPESGGKRKTLEDHVKWVTDQLKMLNGPDFDPNLFSADRLESTAALLAKAKPYFRFRTWKGEKATEGKYKDKEPRVVHIWEGIVDYNPAEATSEEQDDTGPATAPARASVNGVGKKPGKMAVAAPREPADADVPDDVDQDQEPTTEPGDGKEFNEFADLDTVAQEAQDGDEDAQAKLQELAVQYGVPEKKVAKADSWADVVELIVAAHKEKGGEEEEEESFKVGQVAKYHPLDKNKKPSLKAVDVDILAIDREKETATLKNLGDGRTLYKNVPLASLK